MRLTTVFVTIVLVVSALAFSIWAINRRDPLTIAQTQSQRFFRAPNRVRSGTVNHRIDVNWSGGPSIIDWYDSDWEPTSRGRGLLSLYVDGRRIASAVAGSGQSRSAVIVYQDGPGFLSSGYSLPQGHHVIETRLVLIGKHRPGAHWGLPYTDPSQLGVDTLNISPATP